MRTLFLLVAALGAATFAEDPKPKPSLADTPLARTEEWIASIQVTRGSEAIGTIVIRLHDKYAPQHVRNFVRLGESGFYDGTLFHRVSKGSFVQGGDPLSRDTDPKNDGQGGPGYTLPKALNDKKHTRGAVAAAAMGEKDSGSQFFIDLAEKPNFDGQYTVFGHVIRGLDVCDAIGDAKLADERPLVPHRMTVRIEKRQKQLKL